VACTIDPYAVAAAIVACTTDPYAAAAAIVAGLA
jgi:hypothetical protein